MEKSLQEMKEDLIQEMNNSKIKVLDLEASLRKLLETKKSIARFGDGELDLILGRQLKFQKLDKKLSERLEEILKSKTDKCFIGIPDALVAFENLTEESEKFWIKNMYRTRASWLKYLNNDITYCTANITRLYIRYKDKSKCGEYFDLLKKIWENREIVICEGEKTRFGVGNDLLNKCKSVERIICPAEDAFDRYDEILENIRKQKQDKLYIIALGPTATVLAYDLAQEGYQALDIGHCDIEYEWFNRNVVEKEKIDNKYTNEVSEGNEVNDDFEDEEYQKQIITKII